jgi:hypothetical protein
MNKFCLLPISLILLNPGFAENPVTPAPFSEVTIVSVDTSQERHPDVAFINAETKEPLQLDIDPELIEELKEEITAVILSKPTVNSDLIVDASEQEITFTSEEQRAKAYQPRVRQQVPQYQQQMMEEEEFDEEEVIETPRSKAHAYSSQSNKAPQARSQQSTAVEQDSQQMLEKKQGSHVKRYPSQAAKTPKAQAEKQQQNQAPKQRPQQLQPAKSLRAQPNTVDAESRTYKGSQDAPRMQDDTADAEFDAPVQQQRKSSGQGITKKNAAQSQQREQAQVQQPQKNPARQGSSQKHPQSRQSNSYEKNGAYAPPAASYQGSTVAKKNANHAPNKVAQMRSQRSMSSDDQSDQMNQMSNQQNMQNSQTKMMMNTPVRPMVKDGYDIWVMGDVLLWQAVEENLTYAYKGNNNSSQRNRNLHTVDFDWDWGFRFGLGYNAPRDGWDFDLYWTHIRNTADDHIHSGDVNGLYQVWTVASHLLPGTVTEASAHWRVHLDQVDLDLGREFYVGRHLTLRPYVGARSTWLFQEYDVKYENLAGTKQEADLKNRFWGFGFAAGLDTDWDLAWGISMYGEADMSILLGFFDVDQKGEQNDQRIWSQDKSFRAGRAIMDLGMGLKWNRMFWNDRVGLTLKAGYEYHLYFDQNQFILTNGNDAFELFNPVHGNLIYQGVIGSIQLDF